MWFVLLLLSVQVQYIAGGATQNAIRVAQWMIGSPGGWRVLVVVVVVVVDCVVSWSRAVVASW